MNYTLEDIKSFINDRPEDLKNYLEQGFKILLKELNTFDEYVSKFGLEHEQFVLDFYDSLNEISCRK